MTPPDTSQRLCVPTLPPPPTAIVRASHASRSAKKRLCDSTCASSMRRDSDPTRHATDAEHVCGQNTPHATAPMRAPSPPSFFVCSAPAAPGQR